MNRLLSFFARRLFPIWYARHIGVKVGKGCRLISVSYSTEPYLIQIGDHVSATLCHFETHDGGVWVCRDQNPDIDAPGTITVGNNVFIGHGSIILPNTQIGDNVVIGARSVVKGVIPSNVVVAGVPAKIIRPISEYISSSISRSSNTARLTAKQKRAALEVLFFDNRK
jgi:acetyltransferase-like isoleucine patch superfamily enzyme